MSLDDVARPTTPILFHGFQRRNSTHVPRGGTGLMSTDTSSKRREANIKNAARSTGPRSAAGKDRSRFNAVKHGMAARLPVLPGEDPTPSAPPDAWTAELEPRGQVERPRRPRRACLLAARAGRPRQAARLAPRPRPPAPTAGRRPVRRGPRAGPTPLLGPAGPAAALPPPRQQPRQELRPLLLVRRDRRPQRAGPILNRLEGTAMGCAGCSTAGTSCARCWRAAGPGSRRTGCGRSGCWASSRWTPSRTTG